MKISPFKRIIVEGMDGSGKTTLVKQLHEFLGDRADLVPGYNRQPDPKPTMQRWWMEQLARNPVDKVTLHDRFFYPEFVYGPVLRNKINMDKSTKDYVLSFLRTRAFLIYCRPPVEVLHKGIQVEDQMKGVKENFNELLIAYDKLMIDEAPAYVWRFSMYDWTDPKAFQRLVTKITGYIY